MTAVAPSFAEMGESVERIIRECGGSESPELLGATPAFLTYEGREDVDQEDMGTGVDNTALSADYLLVLSCCWQTMKVSSFL